MKNPASEKPGVEIVQKNGSRKLIAEMLESAAHLLEDGHRYDLKIVIKRKTPKEASHG